MFASHLTGRVRLRHAVFPLFAAHRGWSRPAQVDGNFNHSFFSLCTAYSQGSTPILHLIRAVYRKRVHPTLAASSEISPMVVEHCQAAFLPPASFFIPPMMVEHCQAAFRLPASHFHLPRQMKVTKAKATPIACVPALRSGQPVLLAFHGRLLNSLRSDRRKPLSIKSCATRRSQTGNSRTGAVWHRFARQWFFQGKVRL